jgi:hypothetical protein
MKIYGADYLHIYPLIGSRLLIAIRIRGLYVNLGVFLDFQFAKDAHRDPRQLRRRRGGDGFRSAAHARPARYSRARPPWHEMLLPIRRVLLPPARPRR